MEWAMGILNVDMKANIQECLNKNYSEAFLDKNQEQHAQENAISLFQHR